MTWHEMNEKPLFSSVKNEISMKPIHPRTRIICGEIIFLTELKFVKGLNEEYML